MNSKIFNHLIEELRGAFSLSRWENVCANINEFTIVTSLPWTPKRLDKFKQDIISTFDVDVSLDQTVAELTMDIDTQYSARFWGCGIWQPKTDQYQYTGWGIVDEIKRRSPKAVLDVGCGYNQFKPRIPNLTGIDKYNNSADYMVGLLEFETHHTYDAVIVFGSINFGSYEDVSTDFKKVFELTAPGGRVYVRANPGRTHKNGIWIEIYPWDFATAERISVEHNVTLVTFKKDNQDRLYFVYDKPEVAAE